MKKLQTLLYVVSIVVAVGIGIFHNGQLNDKSVMTGSGGPGCTYKGYTWNSQCSTAVASCSSGGWYVATYNGSTTSTTGDYKADGTTTIYSGTCAGQGCSHPWTQSLTTSGCSGGG